MPTSTLFVGFAADPSTLADTLRTAATRIAGIPDVKVVTWEKLSVGGRLLIEPIEAAIRDADISAFDLTQLNDNVLFELGIAIGADRIVWPLRDPTDTTRSNEWKALGLLDTVGQIRFTNSEHIQAAFLTERPDLQGDRLFSTMLSPGLEPREPTLFYAAEPHQTDAGRQVTETLEHRASEQLPLVIADPLEASVQTLPWYAQQVYSASVVVVHLASLRRLEAPVHNARASLIAGLARGLKRPLLMLAEEDHESALDYRELLYLYKSADDCATRLNYWLQRELAPTERRLVEVRDEAEARRLSTELGSIDLGDYVAENEANGLKRYFVETASYRSVLSGASQVYVGAKGSGKSATVMQGENEIRADRRDLVCTIKPAGYDFDAVVRLLTSYEERDERGYVAESLWKYLLTTELALAVERDLGARPAGAMPDSSEWQLLQYITDNEKWLKADFATRLERAVDNLLKSSRHSKIADQRASISEAIHMGPLRSLRQVLAPALATRRRVYVIADNLDKAWDSRADLGQLSRLLLGLLSCMDSFRNELQRAARNGEFDLSLSLFIRSDIFTVVSGLAGEPDKLPVRQIQWEDEVTLLDIVEHRYATSRKRETVRGELWSRYFCENVGSRRTTEWLTWVCLPRPRDLLFLCRAAIDHAVSRSNVRVEEDDLIAAQRQYSLFAFQSASVESQLRIENVDKMLLEFAGVPTSLSEALLRDVLSSGNIEISAQGPVIDTLRDVSFLGVRVGETQTIFTSIARDKQRADVLAQRWAKTRRGGDDGIVNQRYEIEYEVHPAFWAYLGMEIADRTLNLGV